MVAEQAVAALKQHLPLRTTRAAAVAMQEATVEGTGEAVSAPMDVAGDRFVTPFFDWLNGRTTCQAVWQRAADL